jgi:hypothetical protein
MFRVMSRVVAAAAVCVLAAACSPDAPTAPMDSPDLAAALAPGTYGLIVSVLDPSQNPVTGVYVTVTNVQSGDYVLGRTGVLGRADFRLAAGDYIVHARNLSDPGPIVPPFPQPLVIAPLPDNVRLISTGPTQGQNFLGVIYDPGASSGWVPLDPQNYSRLTVSPALTFSGPSFSKQITLGFINGGNLACNFIDSNGGPLSLPSTENVFVILPLAGAGPVPPLPSFASNLTLARGILLGVTTAPAGSTGCQFGGFSTGGPFTAVIETNPVDIGGNGQPFIFVGSVPPGGTQVNMVAEPQRANIGYLIDPLGDNAGAEDIDLTTHGWEFIGGAPTDNFVVASRFHGTGDYLLDARWTNPNGGGPVEFTLRAHCDATSCVKTLVEPASMANAASVGGSVFQDAQGVGGTLIFTVNIPGVNDLVFRVLGGRPPRSDFAPDSGFQQSTKAGTGNTWVVPGD